MSAHYENALRGSRRSAEDIRNKVLRNLKLYENNFPDDALNRLKYSLAMLRSICLAANKSDVVNIDIYSQIVESLLGPQMEPKSNSTHWVHFIDNLRYLHHLFLQKKEYAAASQIVKSVIAQRDSIYEAAHYKYILSIFALHLRAQRLNHNADLAMKEMDLALVGLQSMFNQMYTLTIENGIVFTDLIDEFLQHLCKQPSCLAILPSKTKLNAFEAFFKLLPHTPNDKTSDQTDLIQRYFNFYLLLLQTDVLNKLETPLALLFLRACCSAQVFKNDVEMNYCLVILYNHTKVIYNPNNMSEMYTEICRKTHDFFVKMKIVAQSSQWMMDFLVVFSMLHFYVNQHRTNNAFPNFWKHMTRACVFHGYFIVLEQMMQLTARIKSSTLGPWACCANVRDHVTSTFGHSAQNAFAAYMLIRHGMDGDEIHGKIQQLLYSIIHYNVHAINSMNCLRRVKESDMYAPLAHADLKVFYGCILQILRDSSNHPDDISFCLTAIEKLAIIRDKFSARNWTILWRRLAKTASADWSCFDKSVISEVVSLYVASMLKESFIDWTQLRHQIANYYTISRPGEQVTVKKCISESYAKSNNIVKPQLSHVQENLLLWLEAQHLFKYQKFTTTLRESLLYYAKSNYQVAVLTRYGNTTMHCSIATRFSAIFNDLRTQDVHSLSRVNQLVLAHGYYVVWREKFELRRSQYQLDRVEVTEENLDQLINDPNLPDLNLSAEQYIVDIAVEAIAAFERFFDMADLEFVSMDEALIDWQFILEDLIALANFCEHADYVEHTIHAWHLIYRIASVLDDDNNIIRALSYFCQHADLIAVIYSDNKSSSALSRFDLHATVAKHQTNLLTAIQNVELLNKREQGYLLVCLCHLACYHGQSGHPTYAFLLLQMVQRVHDQLPTRSGKFDIVKCAMEVVCIRLQAQLMMKIVRMPSQIDELKNIGEKNDIVCLSVQRCLLRDIERLLDNLQNFVSISSTDHISYTIFLFEFAQLACEYGANRLHEGSFNGLLLTLLRTALKTGSVLRIVHVFNLWARSNLQMEHMKKAQIKLRVIEQFLGTNQSQPDNNNTTIYYSLLNTTNLLQSSKINTREFETMSEKTPNSKSATCLEAAAHQVGTLSSLCSVSSTKAIHALVPQQLQAMRKVAAPALSPIAMDKLVLSPLTRERSLDYFLQNGSKQKSFLQWLHFMVGCLTARLHYLAGNYDHLENFYKQSLCWLETTTEKARKPDSNMALFCRRYKSMQLLCLQHYINFLRSQHHHEAALIHLDKSLQEIISSNDGVDGLYELNLWLQRNGIQYQMHQQQKQQCERSERVQQQRVINAKTKAKKLPAINSNLKTPKFAIYDEALDAISKELFPYLQQEPISSTSVKNVPPIEKAVEAVQKDGICSSASTAAKMCRSSARATFRHTKPTQNNAKTKKCDLLNVAQMIREEDLPLEENIKLRGRQRPPLQRQRALPTDNDETINPDMKNIEKIDSKEKETSPQTPQTKAPELKLMAFEIRKTRRRCNKRVENDENLSTELPVPSTRSTRSRKPT